MTVSVESTFLERFFHLEPSTSVVSAGLGLVPSTSRLAGLGSFLCSCEALVFLLALRPPSFSFVFVRECSVDSLLNSFSLAGNLWLEEVNLIFVFSEAEIHS